MAKNKRMTSRDHPIKWIEAWRKRKEERKQPTRKQPLDEVFAFPSTTESSNPVDDFIPAPQTSTISIPIDAHNIIYQSGLTHQDGDPANLGEMSGFEEGDEIIGVDGNDCLRVIADKEGLHKWGVSTLMPNDNGQFSVWVYGKGSASGEDYEYVLSVHDDSDDATPVDEESLVIRWEYNGGVDSVLRLYPNLTTAPATFIEIELSEAQWQHEGWHQILATWSYQHQIWSLKWDDIYGTRSAGLGTAWPNWDEFTQVDIFTDLNFENVIYHYVCHLVFGPITDPQALETCVTGEPTGFPNRTDSTFTFTNGTRLFEIDPVGDNFDYYIACQKYTSTGDDITITDTEGLHWIYYDGTILTEAVNPSNDTLDDIFIDNAPVIVIYWDTVNNLGIYKGEERHNLVMDSSTHIYLHWFHGLQWEDGLALNTIDADQSGANDAHAQFGVDAGEVDDEDIHHEIDAVAAVTGLNIFYLDGIAANSRLTTEAGFSCKTTGTGRLAWNQFTLGAWGIAEVTNNKYVLGHTFASTEIDDPMISIMGQAEYNNKSAAQAGALTEINDISLGNLPTPEFRPIATVIYQTSNAYGNAVKARIVTTDEGDDYIDWRTSEIARGTAVSGCCSLDASYDKGRLIDFSSGNGPVKLNFPDGGVVDTITTAVPATTFNIRNLWKQVNEDDAPNVTDLYYTETDDAAGAYDQIGIRSTDSGTNKYLRWRIFSDGRLDGISFEVLNYPTNLDSIHVVSQTNVKFNQQNSNINFSIDSVNINNLFFVDADSDSVGINTASPNVEVEYDINGSLARRFGPDLNLSNGDNDNIDIGDYGKFRITGPTGAFNVTGFAGGCDGRELIIFNNSGQTMTVEHNEGSSIAANRIASGAGDIVIPHVGSCTFDYDDTSNRWRVRSFVN